LLQFFCFRCLFVLKIAPQVTQARSSLSAPLARRAAEMQFREHILALGQYALKAVPQCWQTRS
jgi:hypothetical protein